MNIKPEYHHGGLLRTHCPDDRHIHVVAATCKRLMRGARRVEVAKEQGVGPAAISARLTKARRIPALAPHLPARRKPSVTTAQRAAEIQAAKDAWLARIAA